MNASLGKEEGVSRRETHGVLSGEMLRTTYSGTHEKQKGRGKVNVSEVFIKEQMKKCVWKPANRQRHWETHSKSMGDTP